MSPAVSRASNVVCSIADWKRLYQSAILEHGSSKMAESQHAMLNRAEALVSETKEGASGDLIYALRMLRLLEKAASGERSAA